MTSIVQTARATIQSQSLVNANFDVMINPKLTVSVWATNLFNHHYINSVYDAPGTLGLVNYAPPLEWGVSAGYRF